MMDAINKLFKFLFRHKLKIFGTFVLSFIFLIILFPVNDLNDLITSEISKFTNKKVFLQFDSISLNPLGPRLTLDKVLVEANSFPTLTADSFSINPSLSALLSRQPEGELSIQGFLKGNMHISLKSAKKSDSGLGRSKMDLQVKDIELKEVRTLADLPMALNGKLNLNSSFLADLSFVEQPEGEFNINILRFDMPGASVALPDLGSVNLPGLKMALIELKGKLSGGKLTIESGKLGNANDEFFGDIKGELGLTFMNSNGQIVPILNNYDVDLNLKASSAFHSQAKFILDFFLSNCRTDLPEGVQYKCKVKGLSMGMPPQVTSLR